MTDLVELKINEWKRQIDEVKDFVNANLRPVINMFIYNHMKRKSTPNQRLWSHCDMLFTAFLISGSMRYLHGDVHAGHDLYMHHLQAWLMALSRDEAQDGFQTRYKEEFKIPPRVADAEKILQELVSARIAFFKDNANLKWTGFDTLLLGMGEHCNKPYKFFCLCLTYIVQQDCGDLYQHLMEFDNTVTCGWFDSSNTDDAAAFVARAETFLLRNFSCMLLRRYAGMPGTFATIKPDAWAALPSVSPSDGTSLKTLKMWNMPMRANPYLTRARITQHTS